MEGIQILENTPERLVILQPAEQVGVLSMILIGLALALVVISLRHPVFQGGKRFFALIPLFMGGLIGIVNVYGAGTSWRVVATRQDGLLRRSVTWFGKSTSSAQLRLADVRYALIQKSGRAQGSRLVIVTGDDREFVPMNATFTDVRGLDAAKNAINRFVGTESHGPAR